MNEGSMVRLERDTRGITIGCTEGILWITQKDDFTDYLLHSGERLVVDRKGLVIITALTDTKASITGHLAHIIYKLREPKRKTKY